MDESQITQIGIRINKNYNNAVKRYQSFVMLNQGRRITKDVAIEELLANGLHTTLPRDIFNDLDIEFPKQTRRTKLAAT